jgi:chromosome segregation ATPase
VSSDDPTLPGTPRTRRSSTDVDLVEVREALAVRRGLSVQSLRAIEQLEPALRELRQATSSEQRIEALRAIIRVVRSSGRQLEAQVAGLEESLVTAKQTIELLTPYRAMYERAAERAKALAKEVETLRDQLRAVRGGR